MGVLWRCPGPRTRRLGLGQRHPASEPVVYRPQGGNRSPIVGRPGPATLVGCPGEERSPSPETLIENTGQVVGFGRTEDRSDGVSHEGDWPTLRLHGVVATIQARPVLLQQIVETVHRVGVFTGTAAALLTPGGGFRGRACNSGCSPRTPWAEVRTTQRSVFRPCLMATTSSSCASGHRPGEMRLSCATPDVATTGSMTASPFAR